MFIGTHMYVSDLSLIIYIDVSKGEYMNMNMTAWGKGWERSNSFFWVKTSSKKNFYKKKMIKLIFKKKKVSKVKHLIFLMTWYFFEKNPPKINRK